MPNTFQYSRATSPLPSSALTISCTRAFSSAADCSSLSSLSSYALRLHLTSDFGDASVRSTRASSGAPPVLAAGRTPGVRAWRRNSGRGLRVHCRWRAPELETQMSLHKHQRCHRRRRGLPRPAPSYEETDISDRREKRKASVHYTDTEEQRDVEESPASFVNSSTFISSLICFGMATTPFQESKHRTRPHPTVFTTSPMSPFPGSERKLQAWSPLSFSFLTNALPTTIPLLGVQCELSACIEAVLGLF